MEQWVAFLDAHRVRNEIFTDYRAHVSELLRARVEALNALDAPDGFGKFHLDYVQYEFMKRLAQRCPEHVGSAALSRGSNMDGSPWTHYSFAALNNVLPGSASEALFHRVDRRKAGDEMRYYLSTRQYARVKGNPEARSAKVQRLRALRVLFKQAAEAAGTTLSFTTPSGDHQGANESEIAVLFFTGDPNNVTSALEEFPHVHRAFVEMVAASNLRAFDPC